MNIIIGSGLNALLARHILGSSYRLISAGPSRFYGVNPAPADNFILANELLQPLENQLQQLNIDTRRHDYKCCWSMAGVLNGEFNVEHCAFWLAKVFGLYVPTHLQLVYQNRMQFQVYGTRVNQLYAALSEKYMPEIQKGVTVNAIDRIEPNTVYLKDGTTLEFEKCISTIPLDDLAKLLNHHITLTGVDISVILVQTSSLDFEGFNQTLVVDPAIEFFKVVQAKEDQYVFSFLGKTEKPGLYLSAYLQDFDLISGFYYPKCIPSGVINSTSWLREYGITPIGMSAQWDAAMDVSSSIYRLLRFADGAIV